MTLEKLILPPNESQVDAIKSNIGEDSARFENNLKLLERWIECQPHMPKNYEKRMLSVYLRGCKHDMEETKRKLQSFLLCRATMPDLFNFREFSGKDRKIYDNLILNLLPRLTDEGYRVTYFGIRSNDLDLFDINMYNNVVWMIGNMRACREEMNAGDVYIFNCKGFTAAHASKMLCNATKKTIFVSQEAFPMRIKAVYVINAPGYVETLVNVLKMFFKEKLRSRVQVDSGTEILKSIPEKCLPKELGGTDCTADELTVRLNECFEENKNWFEEQKKVVLSGAIPKQLEQRCTFDDTAGIDGSFRKLNID